MSIWMDLTYSLRNWQGGVVGIVRAELEIAKQLKTQKEDMRFFVHELREGFVEIPSSDLVWLWEATNVGDAYMQQMGRNKGANMLHPELPVESANDYPSLLLQARASNLSRLERLKFGLYLWKNVSPSAPKTAISFIGRAGIRIVMPVANVGHRLQNKRRVRRMEKMQPLAAVQEQVEWKNPFSPYDVLFSCGWIDEPKQNSFTRVKLEIPSAQLIYLVFDLFLIKKEFSFQNKMGTEAFARYFVWVSENCDYLLYGGKTAQRDGELYQREHSLPCPGSAFVKFGSDHQPLPKGIDRKAVLRKYGIDPTFVLAVGSFHWKKNYILLYKAYAILADQNLLNKVPMLVLAGADLDGPHSEYNNIRMDPRVNQKIIAVNPSDEERNVLYELCQYTLLPTLYEGWSLTLPEAFEFHKFCLCSDVGPLREIGEEFADFEDSGDPMLWKDKILYYAEHPEAVRQYENKIRCSWKPITWLDCGKRVLDQLEQRSAAATLRLQDEDEQGTLYYDISLIMDGHNHNFPVSGILRTELLLARHLGMLYPEMKYFKLDQKGCSVIPRTYLHWLFSEESIEHAYQSAKEDMVRLYAALPIYNTSRRKPSQAQQRVQKQAEALWMINSSLPRPLWLHAPEVDETETETETMENQKEALISSIKKAFHKGDVVFTVGFACSRHHAEIFCAKESNEFAFVSMVFDYTPILYPQTHQQSTLAAYPPLLEGANALSDVIFYGGETAMRDGERYQREQGQTVRPGFAVRFGSDIAHGDPMTEEEACLKEMGVTGDFLLTVGSIEARKNHATLYQAYLRLLAQGKIDLPQLVFAGYPGWKTEALCEALRNDPRVQGKILLVTPTDEQMNVLYRRCKFTMLASQYEGWSLTLPESLNYGKFCLTSDVDPLREIGKDFVDYVHPFDTVGWADKMYHYLHDLEALGKYERKIAQEWRSITWEECARQVGGKLKTLMHTGA